MMTKQETLLQALHIAMEWSGVSALEPDEVTGLGTILGLRTDEIVELAQRLRGDGLIDLEWSGTVMLTEKGREQASGRARQASIYLAEGATYVGPGAQISNSAIGSGAVSGSAIGQGAKAQGATRIDIRPGELVVGLSELRRIQDDFSPDGQQEAQRLAVEVQSIVEETQKPHPDKAVLEKHLDRTKGMLERLVGIGETAEKLGPVLKLIAKGLGLMGLVPGL